ncbi:MAG: HIT family protein [Lachnospiraceae bacterium]|nr:HIT family protein [Candidatus Colinaster scatohippi]
MRDDNCIFCKLANGDIPTNSIYEDDNYKVILDMSPATKGHALILPKDHYKNLYEMPEECVTSAFTLAKKMAVTMTEKLGAEGFNIVQNNNEVAGQTVFHFHIHLIPRYSSDNQKIGWNPTSPSADELENIKNLLTK